MAASEPLERAKFSSICIFDRTLSVSDEEAGLAESCGKILYFNPPTVALASQLRHVRFCEGLLGVCGTFSRGSGEEGAACIHMHQRRYAFLEIEPGIWSVLVLVNPLVEHGRHPAEVMALDPTLDLGIPEESRNSGSSSPVVKKSVDAETGGGASPVSSLARSVRSFFGLRESSGVSKGGAASPSPDKRKGKQQEAVEPLNGGGGRGGGGSGGLPLAPEGAWYSSGDVGEAALLGVLRRLHEQHRVFYGPLSWLLRGDNAREACEAPLRLWRRRRKLRREVERAVYNAGGSAVGEDVRGMVRKMAAVGAAAALAARLSPARTARLLLRETYDLAVAHTDFGRLTVLDGMPSVPRFRADLETQAAAAQLARQLRSKLEATNVARVRDVAALVDGAAAAGVQANGLGPVLDFLRAVAAQTLANPSTRSPLAAASTRASRPPARLLQAGVRPWWAAEADPIRPVADALNAAVALFRSPDDVDAQTHFESALSVAAAAPAFLVEDVPLALVADEIRSLSSFSDSADPVEAWSLWEEWGLAAPTPPEPPRTNAATAVLTRAREALRAAAHSDARGPISRPEALRFSPAFAPPLTHFASRAGRVGDFVGIPSDFPALDLPVAAPNAGHLVGIRAARAFDGEEPEKSVDIEAVKDRDLEAPAVKTSFSSTTTKKCSSRWEEWGAKGPGLMAVQAASDRFASMQARKRAKDKSKVGTGLDAARAAAAAARSNSPEESNRGKRKSGAKQLLSGLLSKGDDDGSSGVEAPSRPLAAKPGRLSAEEARQRVPSPPRGPEGWTLFVPPLYLASSDGVGFRARGASESGPVSVRLPDSPEMPSTRLVWAQKDGVSYFIFLETLPPEDVSPASPLGVPLDLVVVLRALQTTLNRHGDGATRALAAAAAATAASAASREDALVHDALASLTVVTGDLRAAATDIAPTTTDVATSVAGPIAIAVSRCMEALGDVTGPPGTLVRARIAGSVDGDANYKRKERRRQHLLPEAERVEATRRSGAVIARANTNATVLAVHSGSTPILIKASARASALLEHRFDI